MQVDRELWALDRAHYYGAFGLNADIMVKSKYILSLSLYSTFSFKSTRKNVALSEQMTRITIDDHSVIKKAYFHEPSRGNGLYFEFSRRFQLYPWIPIKEK